MVASGLCADWLYANGISTPRWYDIDGIGREIWGFTCDSPALDSETRQELYTKHAEFVCTKLRKLRKGAHEGKVISSPAEYLKQMLTEKE